MHNDVSDGQLAGAVFVVERCDPDHVPVAALDRNVHDLQGLLVAVAVLADPQRHQVHVGPGRAQGRQNVHHLLG